MNSPQQTSAVDAATSQIDFIIAAVIERGYDDKREEVDDYGVLISSFEFRKLVTFQLYESYFRPKRHEFELQLLSSLVDAAASNPTAAFLSGAVAGGIVGNAAYDVLKQLLAHLIRKLKSIKRACSSFQEIEKNADGVIEFFQGRDQAGMDELCKALDVEPDRIEPLLRLLRFSCRRKGKRRVWTVPQTWRLKRPRRAWGLVNLRKKQ